MVFIIHKYSLFGNFLTRKIRLDGSQQSLALIKLGKSLKLHHFTSFTGHFRILDKELWSEISVRIILIDPAIFFKFDLIFKNVFWNDFIDFIALHFCNCLVNALV